MLFTHHISAVSKSCFHNIPDLRRTTDQTTARTIETFLIHSAIDCCNFLLFILYLQLKLIVFNWSWTACAVTKIPKFHCITPILKDPHWLKINERIVYKVLSLTYKFLKTGHTFFLRSLLSFPSQHSPLYAFHITLSHHSMTSRLEIANRSCYFSAPVLWNVCVGGAAENIYCSGALQNYFLLNMLLIYLLTYANTNIDVDIPIPLEIRS